MATNKYLKSVIDFMHSEGATTPAIDATPTHPKTVAFNATLVSPAGTISNVNDYMLVWAMYDSQPKIVVYAWCADADRWCPIAAAEPMSGVISPDEDMSVDFKSFRLVCGGFDVQSATLSGGNFTLGGTVNAITTMDLPALNTLGQTNIRQFAYQDKNSVEQVALSEGIVTFAPPCGRFRLKQPQTPATTTGVEGLNLSRLLRFSDPERVVVEFNAADSGFLPNGVIAPNATTRVFDSLNSSAVGPSNLFGRQRIRGKVTVTQSTINAIAVSCTVRQKAATFNAATGKWDSVSVNTVVATQTSVTTGYGFSTIVAFDSGYFANAGVLDSMIVEITTLSGVTTFLGGEIDWEFLDVQTEDSAPASIVIVSNVAPNQQVTIGGRLNYEAVPDATTSKNVSSYLRVGDPNELVVASYAFFADPMLTTVLTRTSYASLVENAGTFASEDYQARAYAADWSDIGSFLKTGFKTLLGAAGPIASVLAPSFAPAISVGATALSSMLSADQRAFNASDSRSMNDGESDYRRKRNANILMAADARCADDDDDTLGSMNVPTDVRIGEVRIVAAPQLRAHPRERTLECFHVGPAVAPGEPGIKMVRDRRTMRWKKEESGLRRHVTADRNNLRARAATAHDFLASKTAHYSCSDAVGDDIIGRPIDGEVTAMSDFELMLLTQRDSVGDAYPPDEIAERVVATEVVVRRLVRVPPAPLTNFGPACRCCERMVISWDTERGGPAFVTKVGDTFVAGVVLRPDNPTPINMAYLAQRGAILGEHHIVRAMIGGVEHIAIVRAAPSQPVEMMRCADADDDDFIGDLNLGDEGVDAELAIGPISEPAVEGHILPETAFKIDGAFAALMNGAMLGGKAATIRDFATLTVNYAALRWLNRFIAVRDTKGKPMSPDDILMVKLLVSVLPVGAYNERGNVDTEPYVAAGESDGVRYYSDKRLTDTGPGIIVPGSVFHDLAKITTNRIFVTVEITPLAERMFSGHSWHAAAIAAQMCAPDTCACTGSTIAPPGELGAKIYGAAARGLALVVLGIPNTEGARESIGRVRKQAEEGFGKRTPPRTIRSIGDALSPLDHYPVGIIVWKGEDPRLVALALKLFAGSDKSVTTSQNTTGSVQTKTSRNAQAAARGEVIWGDDKNKMREFGAKKGPWYDSVMSQVRAFLAEKRKGGGTNEQALQAMRAKLLKKNPGTQPFPDTRIFNAFATGGTTLANLKQTFAGFEDVTSEKKVAKQASVSAKQKAVSDVVTSLGDLGF